MPQIIARIKELAKEYFYLPDKALIGNYDELLRIFDIHDSVHKNHPHEGYRVYISRRALKHFVESRKQELLKNHTVIETIANICFAIEKIPEIITNFDFYEFIFPRHFYMKGYSHIGEPQIRIIADQKEKTLEICSIHFRVKRD